jgi:hypothetical protein
MKRHQVAQLIFWILLIGFMIFVFGLEIGLVAAFLFFLYYLDFISSEKESLPKQP